MKPTVAMVRNTLPAKKRAFDLYMNPLAYFVTRPISFYLATILLRTRITANQVTVVSFIFAAAGPFIILMPAQPYNILGVFVAVVIWNILDCTDGNMARWRRSNYRQLSQENNSGEFLDALGYYVLVSVFYIPIGIYLSSGEWWFVLMGAVASTQNVLARLIYQKYLSLGGHAENWERPSLSRIIAFNVYNFSGSNMVLFLLSMLINWGRFYLAIECLLSIAVTAKITYSHYKVLQCGV